MYAFINKRFSPSCVKVSIMTLSSFFCPNSCGLSPDHIWHIYRTHDASFGRLKYVPIIVDPYSLINFALPLSGEAAKGVITSLLKAVTTLGPSGTLKTDGAPAYSAKLSQEFGQQ